MGLLFVVNMHVCVFVPMSLYVIVVMDEDYAADSVFICVHFCVCVCVCASDDIMHTAARAKFDAIHL